MQIFTVPSRHSHMTSVTLRAKNQIMGKPSGKEKENTRKELQNKLTQMLWFNRGLGLTVPKRLYPDVFQTRKKKQQKEEKIR